MRNVRSHALWAMAALLCVGVVACHNGSGHGGSGGSAAIPLGAADSFAILGGDGISNVPTSAITGDIGVSAAAGSTITGFSQPTTACPEITGTVYKVDASGPTCATAIAPAVIDPTLLTSAKHDLRVAYSDAELRILPAPATVSGDQGGATLTPGIYKSTSSLSIASGSLTLDGQGDGNSVWIFQIGSTLTTVGCSPFPCATGGNVTLINGANAANVYWQVGAAATIGQYTNFEGTILAYNDISIGTGARINGRLLSGAQPSGAGAVTLLVNTVVRP